MKVAIFRVDRDYILLPLTETAGEARAVVWPGVQARHRSMHYLVLPGGARTKPQRHADSEAVYYVIRGEGKVDDLDDGSSHAVGPGSVIFITPRNGYRIAAASGSELVFIGGPCPPDPALYAGEPTRGAPIRDRDAAGSPTEESR